MTHTHQFQATDNGRSKPKKIDIDRNGFLFSSSCSSLGRSSSSSDNESNSNESSSSSSDNGDDDADDNDSARSIHRERSVSWAVNTAAAVRVPWPVPVTPEGNPSPPRCQRLFQHTPPCDTSSSSSSSSDSSDSDSDSDSADSTKGSNPSDESDTSVESITPPHATTTKQTTPPMTFKQYHHHRKQRHHFKAATATISPASTSGNERSSDTTTAARETENNNKNKKSCWTSIQALLQATNKTINAADALTAEPFLATQKGLFLALKHRAPASVIGFILTINPRVMDVASSGPTPLQVALHHNAALDVVTLLLEASPFGLCITNSDCPEDPLSYAKRTYGKETNKKCGDDSRYRPGLIELLSRPLSYWVTERNEKRRSLQMQQNQIRQQKQQQQQQQQERQRRYRLQQQQQPGANATKTKSPPLLSPPPSYPLRRPRTRTSSIRPNNNNEKSLSSAAPGGPCSPVPSIRRQSSLPLPKHSALIVDDATAVVSNTTVRSQHQRQDQQRHIQGQHQKQKQNQNRHWYHCQQKPHVHGDTASNDGNTATIDREEIDNVKKLCAQLYRGHKRLAQQMIAARANIDAQSEVLSTMGTKEEILEELSQQQRSEFVRNLIALDMKETAYKGHLNRLENRYVLQLEERLDRCVSSLQMWNETTREGVLNLEAVVEGEAATNAAFRAYVSDWIERRGREVESDTDSSQMEPLYDGGVRRGGRVCRRSDASGILDENSDMTTYGNKFNNEMGFRPRDDQVVGRAAYATNSGRGENFYYHGDQSQLSRTCTTIPYSWKRQWKPCFKNWDRIRVTDSK